MTTALCKSNKDDFKYNIIFGRLFHDKPKITETSWGWAGPSSAEIEVENGGFLLVIKLINLMIWGLVINLINFGFLSLAVFGHFDTFPDGWVGGWVGKN